jgi:cytochrome c oxidase assembly factor CtaG
VTPSKKRRSLLCAAAALILFAAVTSPWVDALADRSFAWHMVEHLVLLFIIPLLALEAHPFAWLGSPRAGWQRAAIAFVQSPPVRTLCSPPVALIIFIAVLWGVHLSPLYEAALEHPAIQVGEHLLLLFAGTLFWIPVTAPPPFPAPPHPLRVVYLFIALPQGALLSVALLSARKPLYEHYAGVGAMADQHNAAAVMWVGGGAILLTAFLMLIARWAARERYVAVTPLAALLLLGVIWTSNASAASTATPPYTSDQARAGQTLFYENCAECHGDRLEGHFGPSLISPDGNLQWESVQYVFGYMTAHMPAGNAGGLTSKQYVDIMAFLLFKHHHAAGSSPLTAAAANANKALIGP